MNIKPGSAQDMNIKNTPHKSGGVKGKWDRMKMSPQEYKELSEKPDCPPYEEILKDIIQRDYNDMNRETAPLKQAEDAVLVDTTELTLEQSAARITEIIKERI